MSAVVCFSHPFLYIFEDYHGRGGLQSVSESPTRRVRGSSVFSSVFILSLFFA